MNKATIIELCMSPDLGGLELSMIWNAKLLQKDFTVLCVMKQSSKISKYFEDSTNVFEIKKQSSFFMFQAAKELAKIIDTNNVKIIHFHWTKDIPFVVLAKKLSKLKPKVVQTRHMTMTRFKSDFYHKFLYKNIDMILGVTQQVKEQVKKFIPSEVCPTVELLYAGVKKTEQLNENDLINLKNELSLSDESFNIGMVGRINEPKGQHLLIKAVDILKKDGLNVNAYFVGHAMEESYLESLKKDVLECKLQENIHFLGFLKNPHSFYQVCDSIVLASKRETFGLVLIEAIQMNTVVIGTNSGGVVEIIDDKETGLLFEAENEFDLAKQIRFCVENSDDVNRMKKNASEKAADLFDEDKQYLKLKSIFEDLV